MMPPPFPILALFGPPAPLVLHMSTAGLTFPARVIGRFRRPVRPNVHAPARVATCDDERDHQRQSQNKATQSLHLQSSRNQQLCSKMLFQNDKLFIFVAKSFYAFSLLAHNRPHGFGFRHFAGFSFKVATMEVGEESSDAAQRNWSRSSGPSRSRRTAKSFREKYLEAKPNGSRYLQRPFSGKTLKTGYFAPETGGGEGYKATIRLHIPVRCSLSHFASSGTSAAPDLLRRP